MHVPHRLEFVTVAIIGISGVLTVLTVTGLFTLESFYIISLIGFLAVLELTSPAVGISRWWPQLRWLLVLGLVVLVGIVIRRALTVLPDGFLP